MKRKAGTPGRIRTADLWFRRPALYPLSYRRALDVPNGSAGRAVCAPHVLAGRTELPPLRFIVLTEPAPGQAVQFAHVGGYCLVKRIHRLPLELRYHLHVMVDGASRPSTARLNASNVGWRETAWCRSNYLRLVVSERGARKDTLPLQRGLVLKDFCTNKVTSGRRVAPASSRPSARRGEPPGWRRYGAVSTCWPSRHATARKPISADRLS